MSKQPKPENAFINLLFNVVVPVFILNKFSGRWGALTALIVAVAFPLSYGVYDIIKRKKINAISVLGLLNVSVTGSLAVLGLGGIWFSIKEAFFPLLIAIFVLASAFTRNPFLETLLLNPQVMNVDLIKEKLATLNTQDHFAKYIRNSTFMLCLSFLVSASLNFILAQRIFLPIDESLAADARATVLNEQIAEMTSKAFAVIAVPSIVFLAFIMWYLIKGIQKTTGLKTDEFLKG